jgi:hypothetical protein
LDVHAATRGISKVNQENRVTVKMLEVARLTRIIGYLIKK